MKKQIIFIILLILNVSGYSYDVSSDEALIAEMNEIMNYNDDFEKIDLSKDYDAKSNRLKIKNLFNELNELSLNDKLEKKVAENDFDSCNVIKDSNDLNFSDKRKLIIEKILKKRNSLQSKKIYILRQKMKFKLEKLLVDLERDDLKTKLKNLENVNKNILYLKNKYYEYKSKYETKNFNGLEKDKISNNLYLYNLVKQITLINQLLDGLNTKVDKSFNSLEKEKNEIKSLKNTLKNNEAKLIQERNELNKILQ